MEYCNNTAGGYFCSCPAGYSGDGIAKCVDIDECSLTPTPCGPVPCMNTQGSFRCGIPNCDVGFIFFGNRCVPEICSRCHRNATCRTRDGGLPASCVCNAGFTGDGLICMKYSPCPQGQTLIDGQCIGCVNCHSNATCQIQRVGSMKGDAGQQVPTRFSCVCKTGFTGNGQLCTDVDECLKTTCPLNFVCENTPGSFSCVCPRGFSHQPKTGTCVQINECTTQTHTCHANARCMDTPGSFRCICTSGYQGNGIECSDTDECTSSPCIVQNTVCNNTIGSYVCECRLGFRQEDTDYSYYYDQEPFKCVDIDECMETRNACPPYSNCSNVPGSFVCLCQTGFTMTRQKTCVDVNECVDGQVRCHRNSHCVNNVGSFACQCNDGYVGNSTFCYGEWTNSIN